MVLYTHVQENQIELSKFEEILQSIFECIAKQADFYKSMLGPHGIHDFKLQMHQAIMDNLEQNSIKLTLGEHDLDISKDMVLHFITSSIIGIAIWWLQNDMKYSPKYTAEQAAKLFTKGPFCALGFTFFFTRSRKSNCTVKNHPIIPGNSHVQTQIAHKLTGTLKVKVPVNDFMLNN